MRRGGDATDPANYRPIASLSVLSQVFEKLIFKQHSNFIEKHNILFGYGFRTGHSISQAITELTDTLRKAIERNLYTCAVLLDFSKAFGTVNDEILFKKLEAYGIRGLPLKWFSSYLTNR